MIIVGPKGLVDAASFYAKKLGIDGLDVTIEIVRTKLPKPMIGACLWDEDENVGIIELDRRGKGRKPILSVLAHEMVHIKQYATGQMRSFGKYVVWEGQTYVEETDDQYWDSPWELEAFGRQEGLYMRWKRRGE